jgi:hypothetical protein
VVVSHHSDATAERNDCFRILTCSNGGTVPRGGIDSQTFGLLNESLITTIKSAIMARSDNFPGVLSAFQLGALNGTGPADTTWPLLRTIVATQILSLTHSFGSEMRVSVDLGPILNLLAATGIMLQDSFVLSNDTNVLELKNFMAVGLVVSLEPHYGFQNVTGVMLPILLNASTAIALGADLDAATLGLLLDVRSSCAAVRVATALAIPGQSISWNEGAVILSDVLQSSLLLLQFSAKPAATESLTLSCAPDLLNSVITITPNSFLLSSSNFGIQVPIGSVTLRLAVQPVPMSLGQARLPFRCVLCATLPVKAHL